MCGRVQTRVGHASVDSALRGWAEQDRMFFIRWTMRLLLCRRSVTRVHCVYLILGFSHIRSEIAPNTMKLKGDTRKYWGITSLVSILQFISEGLTRNTLIYSAYMLYFIQTEVYKPSCHWSYLGGAKCFMKEKREIRTF